MKTSIVAIGNSKGIRIPKAILEHCHIKEDVNLEIEGRTIIIEPLKNKPREKWEKEFKKMEQNRDDQLIINDKIDLAMENWEW